MYRCDKTQKGTDELAHKINWDHFQGVRILLP